MIIQQGELYKNKKTGTVYKIKGFARHTEERGILVLYITHKIPEKLPYARPIDLFVEKFEKVDLPVW